MNLRGELGGGVCWKGKVRWSQNYCGVKADASPCKVITGMQKGLRLEMGGAEGLRKSEEGEGETPILFPPCSLFSVSTSL